MRPPRPVRVSLVGLLVSALSCVFAPSAIAQGEKKQPAKMEEAQRVEAQTLIASVDDFANGKAPANPLPVKWEQNHFIKAVGDKTYVPFTVAIDPGALASAAVAVYVRVVAKGSPPVAQPPTPDKSDEKNKDKKASEPRSPYAFDDLVFMDAQPSTAAGPQRVRRAFDVVPGTYDVYVAVKERGAAGADGSGGAAAAAGTQKVGVLKQEIEAPDLSGRVFTTSSVILAESVELMNTALPPEKQAENPYTIGPMKIVPSATGKFSTKGAVGVIFWIYGAKGQEATKKPDITVDYKFYRKTGDQETYFNKTAPQELNAQTLPPEFDLDAGHVLPGSLELPLTVFPEGDYRLEIEVQDKAAGQKLTRNANFSVAAQ
jgi:hypothetical protein